MILQQEHPQTRSVLVSGLWLPHMVEISTLVQWSAAGQAQRARVIGAVKLADWTLPDVLHIVDPGLLIFLSLGFNI